MKLIKKMITVEFSDEELFEVLQESYSILKYVLDEKNNIPARIQIAAAETRDFLSELINIGCPEN